MADDLVFRLRLVDEFSSGSAKARGELRLLSAGAREFGEGFQEGARQARDAEGAIRSAGDASERAGKAQLGFAGMLKTAVGGLAGLGIANAAKDMVSFGVQTAAANEQAQISFTTLLGSGEKAKAFVGDLQQFAAKTPFEMAGLQQSSSLLLAAGVNADKVIPIMTTLGNVTSGMGTGSEGIQRAVVALQQMNAAGKITGEDLNQLRDAGIPVYDLLASATGKSKEAVVELAQSGKLGKEELGQMMAALESGKGLERFSGLMEAQSNSLTGLWSSFKDNLGQSLGSLIEPAIPALKSGLKWLGDNIGALPENLSRWTAPVRETIATFKGWFTGEGADTEGSPWLEAVGESAATLSDKFNSAKDAVSVFVGWFTGEGSDVDASSGPLAKVAEAAATLRNNWDALSQWFTGTFLPAFTGFITEMWGKLEPLMPKIQMMVEQVRDALGAAWGAIVAGVQRVVAIVTWVWQNFGENIKNILAFLVETLIGVFTGLWQSVMGVFNFFKALFTGDWAGMWEAVKQIFGGVWDAVVSIFQGVWDILVEVVKAGGGMILGKVSEIFSSIPGLIGSALKGLASLLWNALAVPAINAVNGIIGAVNNIPGVSIPLVMTMEPWAGETVSYSDLGSSGQQRRASADRFGDTATSMWRGGSIGNTLAGFAALGGGLGISNIWVGGGGKGYGSGDHQAGRALDLVGPVGRMQSFITRAQAVGDYAALHGSGAAQHVHYVPLNIYGDTASSVRLVAGGIGDTAAPVLGGGASVVVNINGAGDPQVVAQYAVAAIKRELVNARERR